MQDIQDLFSKIRIKDKVQGDKVTGVLYSNETLLHKDPKDKHPERPQRVSSIISKLKEYIEQAKISNVEIQEEIPVCNTEVIQLVHKHEYIDKIDSMFEEIEGIKQKEIQWFGSDTYLNKHTAKASRIAVQGTLTALENVIEGKWSNAFAAIRPPGHHSGHVNNPNGFCIYNNVVIGLQHVRQKYNVKKVCIFDWDVHHGDGTENLTYDDENTLFISLHRYDKKQFYPGSGDPSKIGGKQALGKNINVGWNMSNDSIYIPGTSEYVYAFKRLLEPIIQEFQPELIIVSSGFDSALGDPLGGCGVTPDGYAFMTQKLIEICDKVVVVLEGGYNLESISESAKAVFRILIGERMPLANAQDFWTANKLADKAFPNQIGIEAIEQNLQHLTKYWPVLQQKYLLDYQNLRTCTESKQIAGGHFSSFKIDGDKLYKKAKEHEIRFYVSLNNKEDKYFHENEYLTHHQILPTFYGISNDSLILENIGHGLSDGSIIDLKLGIKSYCPKGTEEKKKSELNKMKLSSNYKLGFRITGMKIKNKEGQIIEDKKGKDFYDKQYQSKKIISQLLLSIFKSNEAKNANIEAIQGSIEFLQKLENFIQNKSKRNSSFLLVVDNNSNRYNYKWIDFTYTGSLSDDIEEPDQQIDTNIHFGIVSLIKILVDLLNENK